MFCQFFSPSLEIPEYLLSICNDVCHLSKMFRDLLLKSAIQHLGVISQTVTGRDFSQIRQTGLTPVVSLSLVAEMPFCQTSATADTRECILHFK